MIKLSHKYLSWLLPGMALVLPLLITVPVFADTGLSVSGAIVVADVSPGQTIIHQMTVSIGDDDPATDITVQVGGFGQSLDGGYQILAASADTGKYSALQFITVDKESFHLEPGKSQNLTATIHVPQDVGAGGRYAIINITAGPSGQGGVATVAAVNVPIVLTVKGTQLIHEGKITALTTSAAVSGKPLDIFTTFQNTGNHHFKVRSEVTISNSKGEVLDTVRTPLTPSSILPAMSLRIEANYIPKETLAAGEYRLKSIIILDDNTVLGETKSSFQIEESYTPPPAPAKMTISAGKAATLQTPGSAIVISFPLGALISDVEVSLRSYPREQVPATPAGFDLATTFFRVDGLTGLLAKEATVTVKYTEADLEKASGDVSRLRLARWDEANKQWAVLKTRVDKEATTLSTTTNQFSTWAVVVAPQGGANWGLIGGVAAGVIIIVALAGYFVVVRRRSY